jgi:hypothetical protein
LSFIKKAGMGFFIITTSLALAGFMGLRPDKFISNLLADTDFLGERRVVRNRLHEPFLSF